LRIRPRKIKIRNKKGKPLNRQLPNPFVIDRIKVTGNKNFKPKKIAKDEDWDAPTGLALGNSLVGLQYEAKKRSLAILFFADTVNTEPGTYYLRFGNCRGEIKLK